MTDWLTDSAIAGICYLIVVASLGILYIAFTSPPDDAD